MPTDPVDRDTFDGGSNKLGNTAPDANTNNGQPGYETTDVNVNGVVVFLSGLLGFVFVFFGFCYLMGNVINRQLVKDDGPPTKWQIQSGTARQLAKGGNLASNPEMDQKDLNRMVAIFPTPRLDVDDGNQATADLHAREDLLLNHYSSAEGQGGAIRIPIDRAMQLVLERGLPVAAVGAPATMLAGDQRPAVTAPLTTGFARTGYELDTIEARAQRMSYTKGTGENHAMLTPPK